MSGSSLSTRPKTLTMDTIMQTIGTYAGLVTAASQWSKISKFLDQFPIINKVLGPLTAITSSYSLYKQASQFWKNPSLKGLFPLLLSAFGVATGINVTLAAFHVLVHTTAHGLMAAIVPVWGWIAAAAIVLLPLAISGLKKLFGIQPPSEHLAAKDIVKEMTPVIWSAGPVLFVAAGTVALLMGWPKPAQAPIMASLTVPESFVTRTVGQKVPLGTDNAPTVLVEPGSGGNPARVVIVSRAGKDSKGESLLNLQSYVLSRDLEFVSGERPQENYIPFFIYQNGKAVPNPELIAALAKQVSLLRSALSGGLDAQEALSALTLAAATDKPGVSPTSSN